MDQEAGLDIPHAAIPPETLTELIEAFILREGTDYGAAEVSLERKVEQIRRQLDRGEVKIVFDQTTETCSIVTSKPERAKSLGSDPQGLDRE